MTARATSRFHSDRLTRRLLGPLFGTACLLATCTGVAVLALLLGSIVAAALGGIPSIRGTPLVPIWVNWRLGSNGWRPRRSR